MKKVLFLIFFVAFGLTVVGQSITKDNIMSHVKSVKEYHSDLYNYTEYCVVFDDGTSGCVYYFPEAWNDWKWHDGKSVAKVPIAGTKQEAFYWLWKDNK
jgi:hypothetical protein